MPSAAIRRLQRFAFTHPLVGPDDAIGPGHALPLAAGAAVLLSLNR